MRPGAIAEPARRSPATRARAPRPRRGARRSATGMPAPPSPRSPTTAPHASRGQRALCGSARARSARHPSSRAIAPSVPVVWAQAPRVVRAPGGSRRSSRRAPGTLDVAAPHRAERPGGAGAPPGRARPRARSKSARLSRPHLLRSFDVAGDVQRAPVGTERLRAQSRRARARPRVLEEALEPADALAGIVERPTIARVRSRAPSPMAIEPLLIAQASAPRMLSCSANAMSMRCPPGRSSPAFRFALRRDGQEELGVAPTDVVGLGRRVEPLERVVADRLEHAEAPGSPAPRRGSCRRATRGSSRSAVADLLSRLQREAPSEDARARGRAPARPARGARSSTRSSRAAFAAAPAHRASGT